MLVQAFVVPFDVKDYSKERGYRWHDSVKGANKHWWREISKDELPQEQTFLDDLHHCGSEFAHYDYLDSYNRFKNS